MQGESSKGKRKYKRKKFRSSLNLSQERASYFFFIGLLIIAIFGCVASGAPKQGFYGILFVSIGILIALFPPVFIPSKLLIIGSTLFLISLSSSLLPRDFTSSQTWRTNLESLGLDTGRLISPHPAATVESLIIFGVVLIIGLCSLGHRISRANFLNIATLFVISVASYTGISMLVIQNKWEWGWDPNNQFGFFANRNHMATLMVMGSLVGVATLFIYLKKKNWMAFIFTLFAVGIACWAILGFSISRAGLILFILSHLIWFVCVWKKYLNYKLVTSFLVLFILSAILFILSDTKLEDRVEKLLTEKESGSKFISSYEKSDFSSVLGLRKYIHLDTYKMIQSEPWTGTGLGTFEFIFPFYKKESVSFHERVLNSDVLHPESNWLDLTSQAGVLSTVLALICILSLLSMTLFSNRKSRWWLLILACIFSVFCILIHGITDVPGQKIGIVLSGILLIGITLKSDHTIDRASPKKMTFIYHLLAVGIFSLGLILVHSQWFNSRAIVFSDTQTLLNKIQNMYQLSINSAKEKDTANQKKHMISAINLTESAIKRSPLNSELHFIRGKLYSFLDGHEDKIKSSFQIEATLDPNWSNLPLRQSQVWLFINMEETRTLWKEALNRAARVNTRYPKLIWNKILEQAIQHPIYIRDAYKMIMSKDDSYFIKSWMNYAGVKNLQIHMPMILKDNMLKSYTKNDILFHWKRISPKDHENYLESSSDQDLK